MKLAPCYTRAKLALSLMNAPDLAARLPNAIAALRSGGVIALPTDTLYALTALASAAAAVDRVYKIKGREDGKPLPLFVADLAAAETIGSFDRAARCLARRFWPGPLTIVVRRQPGFESAALAGGDTVALRAPDHPLTRALLDALGEAVTATSANRSGGPDPVTAAAVHAALGPEVDLVLDGGDCPIGRSSTIVDCSGDIVSVLRPGAVDAAEITAALAAAASVPRR